MNPNANTNAEAVPEAIEAAVEAKPGGSRAEHLAWVKQRALEYVDAGDLTSAIASFASDMGKHEELENHAGVRLGLLLAFSGNLSTQDAMRKFIEGNN